MHPGAARAITLGGVAGAALRWLLLDQVAVPRGFPWPVFALNVVGSLVLGAAMVRARNRPGVLWRDGVGIGFCGGLTTFSTFAVETALLLRDGRAGMALGYLSASVVAALVAVTLGAVAAGEVAAIDDPLEAAP